MSIPDIMLIVFALLFFGPIAIFIFKLMRAGVLGKMKVVKEHLIADIHSVSEGIATRIGGSTWMKYKDDSTGLSVYVISKFGAPNRTYQVKLGENIIGETKSGKLGQELQLSSLEGAVVPKPNNNDIIILLLDGQEYARGAFTSR